MLDNTRVADATTYADANSLRASAEADPLRASAVDSQARPQPAQREDRATVTGGDGRAPRRPSAQPAAPKRELYAVAVEVLHKPSGRWNADIRYTHAVDAVAAKYEVLRCIDWRKESCRVVGVSKVIGYLVLDKQGIILGV